MAFVFVYAEAYALKDELGGGFRGIAIRNTDKEKRRGEIRKSLEEARNDAKRFASELMGDTPCAPGYFRHSKSNWRCNYWA